MCHMETADILVDGAERLGLLSYLVPSGLMVAPGDAVLVPYGKSSRTGMVVGPSRRPEMATREITDRLGVRSTSQDITAAQALAARHFSNENQMLLRCAPPSRKSHPPLTALMATLHAAPTLDITTPKSSGTFVMRHPLSDASQLAAELVMRRLDDVPDAQVLVLCPTVALVESVLARFSSGAARLDSSAASGAWRGFVEGSIQVGIGTRSAMMFSAPRLAAIVVVEADHIAHRSVRQPYVTSTEAALERCERLGAHFVATGLLPPAHILGRTKLASASPPGAPWPEVRLEHRKVGTARRIVPLAVQIEIEHALRRKERVAIVTRDTSRRRCAKCRFDWQVSDTSCPKCQHEYATVSGWDPARLATAFSAPVKSVSIEDAERLRDIDVLVLADVDHVAARPSLTPEYDTALHVLRLSSTLSDSGKVILVSDESEATQTYAALTRSTPRDLARLVYASARSAGMPPFQMLVTLSIGNRKSAPVLGDLPGRVLGPRRTPSGDWVAQVLLHPSEHQKITPHIEDLRRRYQLRVDVSPA